MTFILAMRTLSKKNLNYSVVMIWTLFTLIGIILGRFSIRYLIFSIILEKRGIVVFVIICRKTGTYSPAYKYANVI